MSLPALARVDRILLSILLLGALLVAVLHWLLAPPEKTGGLLRMPSTFFNVGSGAKAAYDVLDELKYPVTRLRRRISPQSLQGIGVLFILRPIVGLAREEVAALEDWVEEGHALVVVPGSASDTFTLGGEGPHDDTFLDDWFEWKEAPAGSQKKAEAFPPLERPAPLRKAEAGDALTAGIAELAVPGRPALRSRVARAEETCKTPRRGSSGRTSGERSGSRSSSATARSLPWPTTIRSRISASAKATTGCCWPTWCGNCRPVIRAKWPSTSFISALPSTTFRRWRSSSSCSPAPGAGRPFRRRWWECWPCLPGPCVSAVRKTWFASRAASTASLPRPPDACSTRRGPPPLPPRPSTAIIASGSAGCCSPSRTVEDRQLREAVERPCRSGRRRRAAAGARAPLQGPPQPAETSCRFSETSPCRGGTRSWNLKRWPRKPRPFGGNFAKSSSAWIPCSIRPWWPCWPAATCSWKGRRARPKRCWCGPCSMAIRGEFHRIQFTPDLMPADIIGVNIFQPQSLAFQFSAGPVFCDLLLADEINRAPAKTQSALLEAMQEGQVSVDREVHPLSPVFTHLRHPEPDRVRRHVPLARGPARPLPLQDRGRLSAEAARDRDPEPLPGGFRRRPAGDLRHRALHERRGACRGPRRRADRSPWRAPLLDYIVSIIRGTRELPSLTLGASPRAAVMLLPGQQGPGGAARTRVRDAGRRPRPGRPGAAAPHRPQSGSGNRGHDRRPVRGPRVGADRGAQDLNDIAHSCRERLVAIHGGSNVYPTSQRNATEGVPYRSGRRPRVTHLNLTTHAPAHAETAALAGLAAARAGLVSRRRPCWYRWPATMWLLLLVAGLTVLVSARPAATGHRAAAAGTPFAGSDEPGGLGDPQWVRHGGPFRVDRGRAGIARAGDGRRCRRRFLPHATAELHYGVRPTRRGLYEFGDIFFRWRLQLGLLIRQMRDQGPRRGEGLSQRGQPGPLRAGRHAAPHDGDRAGAGPGSAAGAACSRACAITCPATIRPTPPGRPPPATAGS